MKPIYANFFSALAIVLSLTNTSNAQCTAAFNDSIDSLTVFFTNQASGNYNWIGYDYGDGVFEPYVSSPTHVYPGPGIYQACQYIQDTIGFCFDYTCDTLYLGGATCMAEYFWWQNGLDIEFFTNAFGAFDSLVWDFGDGSFSNDTMPIHTYANYGTYTACLSIYNAGAICDSSCQVVFLDSNGGSSCNADFSTAPNGLSVNFSNLSTGSYNTQFWDFGDGFGISQAANPSYTYFTAGTYNVCLTIYDTLTGMCFSEICKDVTVTGGGGGGGTCQAAYTYTTNELQFSGNNTSTGNYLTAVWDFGDGSTPSISPDHTYTEAGTYSVCLTVGNIIPFCFSQECKDVTVSELTCNVDFTWSFNDQNVFAFQNLSQGNFNSVKWQFGDGNTSTFSSPYYNYNIPGTYNVCLTTYDNGNVCGNTCKSLDVYPLGANKLADQKQFIAYPNPSNGSFTLSIPTAFDGKITQVEVRDVSGRLIQSEQFMAQHSKNIEIMAASGTYLMKIYAGDFTQMIPIVVKL